MLPAVRSGVSWQLRGSGGAAAPGLQTHKCQGERESSVYSALYSNCTPSAIDCPLLHGASVAEPTVTTATTINHVFTLVNPHILLN